MRRRVWIAICATIGAVGGIADARADDATVKSRGVICADEWGLNKSLGALAAGATNLSNLGCVIVGAPVIVRLAKPYARRGPYGNIEIFLPGENGQVRTAYVCECDLIRP